MNHSFFSRLHATAGGLAFGLIACFFLGSLSSELSGNVVWIGQVKRLVFYTMWAMPVLVALTNLAGKRLAGASRSPLVAVRRQRTRWLLPNGLLLLTLAAYLHYKASHAELDGWFQSAQLVELAIGLTNLVLLGLLLRDGFRLSANQRTSSLVVASQAYPS